MTRVFLRVYLALGLVLALALGLLGLTWRRGEPGPPLPDIVQGMTDTADQVAARLAVTRDPASRETAVAELAASHDLTLEVQPVAPVEAELRLLERERLERGEPVLTARPSGLTLVVPVPDQPLVALVHLQPAPPVDPRVLAVALVLLLGTGLMTYLSIRPIHRQLEALSRATRAFGAGDLAARAPVRSDDASGQLARSFNRMATRVERLVHGREELLRGVSHELRTPLARLRFAVELLADDPDPAAREQREAKIQRDIEDLDALVGELLTYASLDEGLRPQDLTDLDLNAELASLADEARAVRPGGELHLDLPPLPPVSADRRLRRRALSNLLTNAAGYGAGRVEVMGRAEAGWVVLTVDDDGPGVPEADRARIFEPLVRLDAARSRHTGGVGLGLALAQRVVAAHTGRLRVGEAPLGGARFTVELPCTPAPEVP